MNDKLNLSITQTHITTLQSIISRCSNYSLNCKTWAVTIVAAISVILFDPSKISYYYIVFVPIVFFWIFDCYYLGLEKTFRQIYNEFIDKLDKTTKIEDDIKFTLKNKRLKYFLISFLSLSTTPIYAILSFIVFMIYKIIK